MQFYKMVFSRNFTSYVLKRIYFFGITGQNLNIACYRDTDG